MQMNWKHHVSRGLWAVALSAAFGGEMLYATEIIAHRGASYEAPENTLVSARLAYEQGAECVECDIYMTSDGKLAVIHDLDTKRTTGVEGNVEKMTMAAIQKLDAGSWKNPKYAGEKIPTLDELLAVVPDGRKLIVEIKGGAALVPVLKETLDRANKKTEQIVIIAFNYKTLQAVKKLMPQYSTAWLMGYKKDKDGNVPDLDKAIADCKAAGFEALNISKDWPVDAAFVKKVHDAGLKLYTWTLNDAASIRKHVDAGVDAIGTDKPAVMRQEVSK
jgi:glycerophosphoryl diester phosphodiesterase